MNHWKLMSALPCRCTGAPLPQWGFLKRWVACGERARPNAGNQTAEAAKLESGFVS